MFDIAVLDITIVIFVFHRKCTLPVLIQVFYNQVVFMYILSTFRENFQRKLSSLYHVK